MNRRHRWPRQPWPGPASCQLFLRLRRETSAILLAGMVDQVTIRLRSAAGVGCHPAPTRSHHGCDHCPEGRGAIAIGDVRYSPGCFQESAKAFAATFTLPATAGSHEGNHDEPATRGARNNCSGIGQRRRGVSRDGRGPTRWSRAAGQLARLSGGQPIGAMSLVSRGPTGADRQSSYEPGDLGLECLPHLLVRLLRAGQCRSKHL